MSHDRRSRTRRVYLTSKRAHEETMKALLHMHQHQLHILERINDIMSVLDDIKTINAETKEKVIGLGTKLDSALARIAGFKEAIAALKARIEELIAQGGGEISAEDAAGLVTAAQEIEDSTDAATAKADILANTEGDDA